MLAASTTTRGFLAALVVTMAVASATGGCREEDAAKQSNPCPEMPSQGSSTRAPRLATIPEELHPGDNFQVRFTRWEPQDTLLTLWSAGTGGNQCGENYLIYTDHEGTHWVGSAEISSLFLEPRHPNPVPALIPPIATPGDYVLCEPSEFVCSTISVTKER